MTLLILYFLATVALASSLAFLPLILVTAIPLRAVYYDSRIRRPVVWVAALGSLLWMAWDYQVAGRFEWSYLVPLAGMGLALVIVHRLHPSVVFSAVDYPRMSTEPLQLPLDDSAQMAVVEYEGATKAYPLDYLIHGHVINDSFGERLVSLTYCALCRSIIPFDVTEMGALYVGAMKNGNMVLADRKTGTFFQQGTFESVVGPLHPKTLEMISFQFLTWKQVKSLSPMPQVCHVTSHQLREFNLPIPGAWKRLTRGERTPGLSAKKRDKTFPARTSVIGVTDRSIKPQVAYLKSEVLQRGVVKNESSDFFLVARDGVVNAYKASVNGTAVELKVVADGGLRDQLTETTWDVRGKYLGGTIEADLSTMMISDEYWYSWKLFHPRSELIRLA